MADFRDEIDEMLEDYLPPKEKETEVSETEEVAETEDSETTEESTEIEEPDVDDVSVEEVIDEGPEERETDQEEETAEEEESETETETEEEAEEAETADDKNPLYDELNALASGKLTFTEEDVEKEPEKPAEQEQQDTSAKEFSLLDGEEFDEVVSNPEAFTRVLSKGMDHVQSVISQNVMQSVVRVVAQQVHQQIAMKELTDKFWAENQDLTPVRPYVALAASTIQSQNPDMPIEKIFEKTAEAVRKKLGIKGGGKTTTVTKKPSRKPALAKTTGTRKVKTVKKESALEKQISDLLDMEV